ncbi:hypothetical protein [Nocardioides acrostichi]|uniref:Uncharacterized protein n=1 Tax=Nocardioides acrostichi TaxID=2784339 RepID=A0A930UX97_9ACTN|nr:hypothetical protein [Nocardioides acrostichi]MBF4161816.1 hypothetical protein [Nocardioides acrostichi]
MTSTTSAHPTPTTSEDSSTRPTGSSVTAPVRTACLVAAGAWSVLHVTMALLSWELVDEPWLYLAALLGCGLVVVRMLMPLIDPRTRPLGRGEGLMVVAAIGLIEAADLASLHPGELQTYANWAQGWTALLIAVLVLRGRPGHGALAAVTQMGVQVTYLLLEHGVVVSLSDVAQASVAALLWFLGSWGIRSVVQPADRLASRLLGRAVASAGDQVVLGEWVAVREQRVRELEADVLPFLRSVSSGAVSPADAALQASLLSARLRDDLRARVLLDAGVREALVRARARGAVVRLSASTPLDPGRAATGRAVALCVLGGSDVDDVTLRVTPDRLTVAVEGADLEGIAEALPSLLPGVSLTERPGFVWADLLW